MVPQPPFVQDSFFVSSSHHDNHSCCPAPAICGMSESNSHNDEESAALLAPSAIAITRNKLKKHNTAVIKRSRSFASSTNNNDNNNNNNNGITTGADGTLLRSQSPVVLSLSCARSRTLSSDAKSLVARTLSRIAPHRFGGAAAVAATTTMALSNPQDTALPASSLPLPLPTTTTAPKAPPSSFLQPYPNSNTASETLAKLALCFGGLQASYLTWAYLQEFIMTTTFTPTPLNPTGRFPSASFCVFCNRCVALTVAMVAVRIRHGSVSLYGTLLSATTTTTTTTTMTAATTYSNAPPFWVFVPCAITNTLSSISQYASLQYVSFPLMTVFKSSTIIPVMVMGYLIKGTTYPVTRYMEAFLITLGVAIFSFHSVVPEDSNSVDYNNDDSGNSNNNSNTLFGMSLLVGYVIFDSFTTQWQDKIYSMYGRENVDAYQMMLGVDSAAIVFTTAGLLASGELPAVWEFFHANPQNIWCNLACPLASTCGQLCIFYTIAEFGPVVFTIIMTTRKLISIAISSVVFGHVIAPEAAIGGVLVLAAILNGVISSHGKTNGRTGAATRVLSDRKRSDSKLPGHQLQQQDFGPFSGKSGHGNMEPILVNGNPQDDSIPAV